MLKVSDTTALIRLIDITAANNTDAQIIEPNDKFKGDLVSSGYLDDLLVRNGADFTGQDKIQDSAQQLNAFTPTAVRTATYPGASGETETVYGIEVNKGPTLWLTRNAPEPKSVYDFTEDNTTTPASVSEDETAVQTAPVSPVMARALVNDSETEPTEVEDPTWFEKIGELNTNHKAWLLIQFNAAFTRIGRKDLFAELVESIDTK